MILRYFNTVFTSIHVLLQKQGQGALQGPDRTTQIHDFIHCSKIEAKTGSGPFPPGSKIKVKIQLTNQGNFAWINTGLSHRIALGVQLRTPDNSLSDRDHDTISLPKEVLPGETIKFEAEIKAPKTKGRWILRFDLKKELVFWFSEKGNPTYDLQIEIS